MQRATLGFLRERVMQGDADLAQYLSGLEAEASDEKPFDSPNYVVLHATQLEDLARIVQTAQDTYDTRRGADPEP